MSAGERFVRFNGVSAVGVALQLALVWWLTSRSHLGPAAATGIAVAATVVHNFIWHRFWTWGDRRTAAGRTGVALLRFVLANGVVSMAGNLVVVQSVLTVSQIGPVVANIAAIGTCGLFNFWISDRVVFGVRS